jgi:hypothetical protein
VVPEMMATAEAEANRSYFCHAHFIHGIEMSTRLNYCASLRWVRVLKQYFTDSKKMC